VIFFLYRGKDLYVGRRRLRTLDRLQEEGARFNFTNNTVSKHFGLLQEHWRDRRFWNDEKVEKAVRNGSECNKPISARTQNENASGCFVVMSKCD
jgi:hypothetical protein